MTTAVAVIGLGNLGAAMAEHAASLRPLVLVDTDEARRSLHKLADLEPAAAWPGHAEPLTGDVAAQRRSAADA